QGDTTISKARFDVTRLGSLPVDERQAAVDRLHLPEDDPKHMPPLRFRRLSADEIARASSALMP
ncbi:MAG TPA: hypothetical protein VEM76_18815, partial [Anaeromyxobacteraceae bacterium]|nr:hypothetical protein [Anaeromyxobacteraceae bacterium]